jgi:hypothetical protein
VCDAVRFLHIRKRGRKTGESLPLATCEC